MKNLTIIIYLTIFYIGLILFLFYKENTKPTRYSCSTNKVCIYNENGNFDSLKDCLNNCGCKDCGINKYTCKGDGLCYKDENGEYDSILKCVNECSSPKNKIPTILIIISIISVIFIIIMIYLIFNKKTKNEIKNLSSSSEESKNKSIKKSSSSSEKSKTEPIKTEKKEIKTEIKKESITGKKIKLEKT